MHRRFISVLIFASALFAAGCQTASNTNNASSANANNSPLPPGISTSPLPAGATPTPGIPDMSAPKNANQPAGTPTPGIPDMKSQPNNRPSGTPTPGIPDLKSQNKNSNQMNERATPSRGNVAAAEDRATEKKRP